MTYDKQKRKEADARYYARNREKVKAKVKEYNEANKDRIREYKRKWWQRKKRERSGE